MLVNKYVSATELKQSKIFPQPIGLEAQTAAKALHHILESIPDATQIIIRIHRDWFGTTIVAETNEEHA